MSNRRTIRVETREHLLSTLAEAAELEHNLMCLYLYAVFSMKDSPDEDLTAAELEAVQRWRRGIMEVAVQEMTHLALVSNLTTAIGGQAHFFRPNFPVKPGYFPADFVMELAPFDETTLEHFIFLERPEDEAIPDDSLSAQHPAYTRGSPRERLSAYTGDYETVGQLYEAITEGLRRVAEEIGENALFCGSEAVQIGPADVKLPGLTLIKDLAAARKAIRTIVEQGEGARTREGSHFAIFLRIQEEYQHLLQANPGFRPARPAARNPVMRKPTPDATNVLWITGELASKYLDSANAIYNLMLRLLSQVYSHESRSAKDRKLLLDAAFRVMHALAQMASELTKLPADPQQPEVHAGISFSLNRHFNPLEISAERPLLVERIAEINEYLDSLIDELGGEGQRNLQRVRGTLTEVAKDLGINAPSPKSRAPAAY